VAAKPPPLFSAVISSPGCKAAGRRGSAVFSIHGAFRGQSPPGTLMIAMDTAAIVKG